MINPQLIWRTMTWDSNRQHSRFPRIYTVYCYWWFYKPIRTLKLLLNQSCDEIWWMLYKFLLIFLTFVMVLLMTCSPWRHYVCDVIVCLSLCDFCDLRLPWKFFQYFSTNDDLLKKKKKIEILWTSYRKPWSIYRFSSY